LIEVVSELLRERLGPTSEYVQSLISIQAAYINTNHPDFVKGSADAAKESARQAEMKRVEAEKKVSLSLVLPEDFSLKTRIDHRLPKMKILIRLQVQTTMKILLPVTWYQTDDLRRVTRRDDRPPRPFMIVPRTVPTSTTLIYRLPPPPLNLLTRTTNPIPLQLLPSELVELTLLLTSPHLLLPSLTLLLHLMETLSVEQLDESTRTTLIRRKNLS
jgi:hypothetical protein